MVWPQKDGILEVASVLSTRVSFALQNQSNNPNYFYKCDNFWVEFLSGTFKDQIFFLPLRCPSQHTNVGPSEVHALPLGVAAGT